MNSIQGGWLGEFQKKEKFLKLVKLEKKLGVLKKKNNVLQ